MVIVDAKALGPNSSGPARRGPNASRPARRDLTPQIVDQGIILHRCSYLRDFWNVMDALVVVCAAVQATFDLTSVVTPALSGDLPRP